MHPKITILFFIKTFSFFISVARDSNVFFYDLMWSPRQHVGFFSVCYFFHITYYMFLLYFIYILNMCFYFSLLTCTFHFNCCLNKIFVIVILHQMKQSVFLIYFLLNFTLKHIWMLRSPEVTSNLNLCSNFEEPMHTYCHFSDLRVLLCRLDTTFDRIFYIISC